MDTAQLSAAIIAILAPFTPFLVEGGKRLTEHAADAAWSQAHELWSKLKNHFQNDPEIMDDFISLSANTSDTEKLARLAKALTLQLKQNPELAEQLSMQVGGADRVAQVVADNRSWIENVEQDIVGTGSTIVKASDSVVKGVKQTIRN